MALETFAATTGEMAEKTFETVEGTKEKIGPTEDSYDPDKRIDTESLNDIDTNEEKAYDPDKRIETDNMVESKDTGLTEAQKAEIKESTGWSDEIIDSISSYKEYEVLKNADLQEVEINGKKVLIRNDIDWDQVDEKGRTNSERIKKGLAPLDKNGNSIELHHIGQHKDSPLAELTTSEHDMVPHNTTQKTEVHTSENNWDSQRKDHWKARSDYNSEKTKTTGGNN